MRRTYLGLCVVGFVAPYAVLVPWLLENGFDPGLFVEQTLANPIGTFFFADVAVSAVVVIFIAGAGLRRGDMRMVWPIVATLTVGVSLALPLYLYISREDAVPDRAAAAATAPA